MKKNTIAINLNKEEIKEKFIEMGYNPTDEQIEEGIANKEISLYMKGYQDADFYDIEKSTGLNNNLYDGRYDILIY